MAKEKDIPPTDQKPIQLKTDLFWDTIIYLKHDPYQREFMLSGVTIRPGKGVEFILTDLNGDDYSYWDHMCSTEIDEVKKLKSKNDDEGDIE